MPQFTPWAVTDPSPNVLFNPMAVDQAIAETKSKLGELDINRERLGLDQQKLDATRAGNAVWADGNTTGTTGATSGGDGSFLGTLANIESGDQNIVSQTDKDSKGLTLAQGGNPAEISQGHFQIQTATWKDFAPQAGVDVNKYPNAMSAPREVQAQVAATIPFSRFGPRTQQLMRQRFGDIDASKTVGQLAGGGPRVTPAPFAAPVAVATATPPATTPQPANPNARVDIHPSVAQAAAALLAMPEADAALAYGPTIRALQAQGVALAAPPTYPGHAAVQALVGGGAAAVTPSPIVARNPGSVDTAGPGAGPDTTLPPIPAPHQLYQTGLPGVTISGPPGSPLAPPSAPAPVTTAQAAPGSARPGVPQLPPPLSRAIETEPTIQGGIFGGLTQNQAKEIQSMARSLAPTAEIAQRAEVFRQQNITNRQTAATAAAAQQQMDIQQRQWNYEQQVKAGWEDAGNGMIHNKYTGETKYGGPPAPRSTKDEQGNTWLLEPGQPPKLMSGNPSGVTGSGDDASALRLMNEIGPKIASGTATPQEQANYTSATEIYRKPVLQMDPVTKQNLRLYTRNLPSGFPAPPGQPATGGGPEVVTPGLSPAQQEIERDPAAYKVAETNYANDAQDIRPMAEAGRQAQADQVRIKEMQDVLQRFSTGQGTEARTAAANFLQRWLPSAITGWEKQSANLSGADAAQAFSKLALVGAGTQERGVLGARGGYQAIKLFKEANPNIDLQDATNKSILDMQLITNQANQDYTQAAQSHFLDNETKFQTTHKYDSLNRFDRDWNAQRNPEVYSAAMGAISGQPSTQWAKGLSDVEYKRALDIVSRANPSAVVNGKSGRISMQPGGQAASTGQGTGGGAVAVRTPADAAALPPGTQYTTPDGRTFTR